MVKKDKEGFKEAKDIPIEDATKFTYHYESGGDKVFLELEKKDLKKHKVTVLEKHVMELEKMDLKTHKVMELEKVNLKTPWGKVAQNEMELPFRVVYSEDRYMPEGGARAKYPGEKNVGGEKLDKGTIEIGFRGTALELGGGLVDKAKGMEQGLFDTFYLKMPLGGGTMPFGPRRLFRYSDELRHATGGRELPCCCGFQEYCLAGCVAALDGCTTFLCWPCNNVNDTHGFYDWHQAALIKQYGIDGVTASVHSGFYAAAMSTVPTVEQMLNNKFGITRDENMERARMTCCAVHKAP